MYQNKYSPKFPFFNVADEQALYKSLVNNPEPSFVNLTEDTIDCTVPLVNMTLQHWCNNVHMKNPSQHYWRDYWWIFGNYLPNTPTCQQYTIRLNSCNNAQAIMTKLYKRHKTRFINYYNQKI